MREDGRPRWDQPEVPKPAVKRTRKPPWLTAIAALSSLAVLFAYHDKLRRALTTAKDDMDGGAGASDAIALEGAQELKQSLRAITSRLSSTDRAQLGALVDSVVPGAASRTPHHTRTSHALVATGDIRSRGVMETGSADDCGSSCLEVLADKMHKASGGGLRGGIGTSTEGDERRHNRRREDSSMQLKRTFLVSQARKMQAAVARGWVDLRQARPAAARKELQEAERLHESQVRVLRGSADIVHYLATPPAIRALRDGIDEAPDSIQRPSSRSARSLDLSRPTRRKRARLTSKRRIRANGLPRKLQAIMDSHFSSADSNVKSAALLRISRRFGVSEGGATSWTPDGASRETLPAKTGHSLRQDGGLGSDGGLIQLAQRQLSRGRTAVRRGLYRQARKALKKAGMFLSSVRDSVARAQRDGARKAANAGQVGRLQLEYNILSHSVANLRAKRNRVAAAQLQTNLKELDAPIQRQSLSSYFAGNGRGAHAVGADRHFQEHDTADPLRGGGGGGARLRGDRVLFTSAIRKGVADAGRGEIAHAQAKLVEARYYANRNGLLRRQAGMSSRLRQDGRVAKRALKLLARKIVNAEQQTSGDDRISLRNVMGLRERQRAVTNEGRSGVALSRAWHSAWRSSLSSSGEHDGASGAGTRFGFGHRREGSVSSMQESVVRALDPADRGRSSGLGRNRRLSQRQDDGGGLLAGDRNPPPRGSLAAAERWMGMYAKGSDILAAANGEQEETKLADERATQAELTGCSSIHCRLSSGDHSERWSGLGGRGERSLSPGGRRAPREGGRHGEGITATDFGKERTDTHTGMHYSYRLDHLSIAHGGKGFPKLKDVHVPSQTDEGPDIPDSQVGKSGKSGASSGAAIDTGLEVRSEEAHDLKKSMQEAMADYKKLLKHEVRKEEWRAKNDPTMAMSTSIAIATPVGKRLLPALSGRGKTNPAHLGLRALRGQLAPARHAQPVSVAQTLEGTATASRGQQQGHQDSNTAAAGTLTRDSAEALMNSFMRTAKFEGGPWDEQEDSPAVAEAKTGAIITPHYQDTYAVPPPSLPTAGAVPAAQVAVSRRSNAPAAPKNSARGPSEAAQPPRVQAGTPRYIGQGLEGRGRGHVNEGHAASLGAHVGNVAGMLITDIGKDLGF